MESMVEKRFRLKIEEAKRWYLTYLERVSLKDKADCLILCSSKLAQASSLAWVLMPEYSQAYVDESDFVDYCKGKIDCIGVILLLDNGKSHKYYFRGEEK